MACYPCNPYLHLLAGTTIVELGLQCARRSYVVLGGELPMVCDEWAIAMLELGISPEEFICADTMICNFLENHGWRINYTSRCGMGTIVI